MAQILDGLQLSAEIKKEIKQDVDKSSAPEKECLI